MVLISVLTILFLPKLSCCSISLPQSSLEDSLSGFVTIALTPKKLLKAKIPNFFLGILLPECNLVVVMYSLKLY